MGLSAKRDSFYNWQGKDVNIRQQLLLAQAPEIGIEFVGDDHPLFQVETSDGEALRAVAFLPSPSHPAPPDRRSTLLSLAGRAAGPLRCRSLRRDLATMCTMKCGKQSRSRLFARAHDLAEGPTAPRSGTGRGRGRLGGAHHRIGADPATFRFPGRPTASVTYPKRLQNVLTSGLKLRPLPDCPGGPARTSVSGKCASCVAPRRRLH